MASARHEILDWAEKGRIAPERLRSALEAGGVLPDADRWRNFLDRLLLFAGAVLLAVGVIFFFAFNWDDLSRTTKFALAQAPIVAALVLIGKLDLEGIAGKALLLAAALLVGALLALVGQTYQTGADTFELFIAWALAILPWVLVGRFPVLWIVWLLLVNLAAILYFQTFARLLWLIFSPEKMIWVLFGLNTVALVVWEGLAMAGIQWLRERWSVRIIATASGGLVTALAVYAIASSGYEKASGWGVPAWLAWMAAAYYFYRHRMRDLFVLAGGVLSAIVVVTTGLGKSLRFDDAGVFLLISMVVIGMSAAGGWWLRQVAKEEA